ncbi:MAG: hypothetical protein HY895_01920 [Deltaproteobacteria bacterium]|nr:hypothetical protein [Deltaproteobacteria bacterium]
MRTLRTVPSVAATPSPWSMDTSRLTPRLGCSSAAAEILSRFSGLSLIEDFFDGRLGGMANYLLAQLQALFIMAGHFLYYHDPQGSTKHYK